MFLVLFSSFDPPFPCRTPLISHCLARWGQHHLAPTSIHGDISDQKLAKRRDDEGGREGDWQWESSHPPSTRFLPITDTRFKSLTLSPNQSRTLSSLFVSATRRWIRWKRREEGRVNEQLMCGSRWTTPKRSSEHGKRFRDRRSGFSPSEVRGGIHALVSSPQCSHSHRCVVCPP